jgi:hypothetical protein
VLTVSIIRENFFYIGVICMLESNKIWRRQNCGTFVKICDADIHILIIHRKNLFELAARKIPMSSANCVPHCQNRFQSAAKIKLSLILSTTPGPACPDH